MYLIFFVSAFVACSNQPSLEMNSNSHSNFSGMSHTLSAPPGHSTPPVVPLPCLNPAEYIGAHEDLKNHLRSHNITDFNDPVAQYFAFRHFLEYGYNEARSGHQCGKNQGFDEAGYLSVNHDVKEHLEGKILKPGLTHWIYHGREEGRSGSGLNNSGSSQGSSPLNQVQGRCVNNQVNFNALGSFEVPWNHVDDCNNLESHLTKLFQSFPHTENYLIEIGMLYGPGLEFYQITSDQDRNARYKDKLQSLIQSNPTLKMYHEKLLDKNLGIFPNRFLIVRVTDHQNNSMNFKGITHIGYQDGGRPRSGSLTLDDWASAKLNAHDLTETFFQKNTNQYKISWEKFQPFQEKLKQEAMVSGYNEHHAYFVPILKFDSKQDSNFSPNAYIQQ